MWYDKSPYTSPGDLEYLFKQPYQYFLEKLRGEMLTSWWCDRKNQGIAKIIGINQLNEGFTKCHGNPSHRSRDISLHARNVKPLQAVENKPMTPWSQHSSHTRSWMSAQNYNLTYLVVTMTCDYIKPLFRFQLIVLYKMSDFHVTDICIQSVPRLVISLLLSSQPLGLVYSLKVRQVIMPTRKPLSGDRWHLAMTHTHSCNPPHAAFVIET